MKVREGEREGGRQRGGEGERQREREREGGERERQSTGLRDTGQDPITVVAVFLLLIPSSLCQHSCCLLHVTMIPHI